MQCMAAVQGQRHVFKRLADMWVAGEGHRQSKQEAGRTVPEALTANRDIGMDRVGCHSYYTL